MENQTKRKTIGGLAALAGVGLFLIPIAGCEKYTKKTPYSKSSPASNYEQNKREFEAQIPEDGFSKRNERAEKLYPLEYYLTVERRENPEMRGTDIRDAKGRLNQRIFTYTNPSLKGFQRTEFFDKDGNLARVIITNTISHNREHEEETVYDVRLDYKTGKFDVKVNRLNISGSH